MLPDAQGDLAHLGESLLRRLPGIALGIGILQLDPISISRPSHRPRITTVDYIETAWIDIDGTYDDYWESRGKNLRTNLRKQRGKLEAEGTEIRFDIIDNPERVVDAVTAYAQLEKAGWKGEVGTAVDTETSQGKFYIDALTNFCKRQSGQIWQLCFGDRVVAMDLCIEQGGVLVILKTAYDTRYTNSSPASLLKQDAFRKAFGDGELRRVEFYGRRMEWHTRWTSNSRTLYHANIYRWAFVPKLHNLLKRMLSRNKKTPTHD
jgi:hypothetical protein